MSRKGSSKYLALQFPSRLSYCTRWRRIKAAERHAANLRSDGQPRQRPVYQRYPDLDRLPATQRVTARNKRWRHRRIAAGLTIRGTKPKVTARPELHGLARPDYDREYSRIRRRIDFGKPGPLEIQWREFRAQLESVAAAVLISAFSFQHFSFSPL